MVVHNGKQYRSKKHPILEYIFNKYNPNCDSEKKIIPFTLWDIHEGYNKCGIDEPASISNTILDLCRQNRGIQSRLPDSIIEKGYDLRKRTGSSQDMHSLAGEFVYVGKGNEIKSWLEWPLKFDYEIKISSINIPAEVRPYLRNDEGSLFSVFDYCDVLSQVLFIVHDIKNVKRIQNPIKWQPNEIDGFYISKEEKRVVLFPIEAKALTTHDDINLEQVQGALTTFHSNYAKHDLYVMPIAIQMVTNGAKIAIFNECKSTEHEPKIILFKTVKIYFDPVIESWI
jgi:hypothetical protein